MQDYYQISLTNLYISLSKKNNTNDKKLSSSKNYAKNISSYKTLVNLNLI